MRSLRKLFAGRRCANKRAIEGAIRTGLVRSVDEFIETAVKELPRPKVRSMRKRLVWPRPEFGNSVKASGSNAAGCRSARWRISGTNIETGVRFGCLRLHAVGLRGRIDTGLRRNVYAFRSRMDRARSESDCGEGTDGGQFMQEMLDELDAGHRRKASCVRSKSG